MLAGLKTEGKGVEHLLFLIITSNHSGILRYCTARKIKSPLQDFLSKCKQLRYYLCISSHLLKKPLKGNLTFRRF